MENLPLLHRRLLRLCLLVLPFIILCLLQASATVIGASPSGGGGFYVDVAAFGEDAVANRSGAVQLTLGGTPAPTAGRLYLPLVERGPVVSPPTLSATPNPTITLSPTLTPVATTVATPATLTDPTFGINGRVISVLGHSFGVEWATVITRQADGKVIAGNNHTLFRVTSDGVLDETFGTAGLVTVLPLLNTIAVQPDGKIVVGGRLKAEGLETISDFVVVRYDAAGHLDPTFANHGVLRIPNQSTKFVQVQQLLPQPDGTLIVLGNLPNQAGAIAATPVLVRLLANGTLDQSFGDEGKRFFVDPAFPYLSFYTLAQQADGKLFVAGDIGTGNDEDQVILLRLQPDGTLDPTFADGGQFVTDFGAKLHSVNAIAFQPDAKIILAVSAPYGLFSTDNFELVRLLPNGALDATFGSGGRATLDLADPQGEAATALALLPDGKILVGGLLGTAFDPVLARFTAAGMVDTTFGTLGRVTFNEPDDHRLVNLQLLPLPDGQLMLASMTNQWQNGPKQLALLRLQADGTSDPTFADGGELLWSPGNSVAKALLVQRDHKIVVGGYTSYNKQGGPGDWTLLRYNPDGSLDPSFDGDGKIVTAFREGVGNAWVQSLALQPDDKIVALGQIYFPADERYGAGVIRYTPAGMLDPTFGAGGQLTTPLPLELTETNHVLLLQPDGKIVAAGNATVDSQATFVLVRLLADGAVDQTFGRDGQATTAFVAQATLRALALQPDGKLVAAGHARDPQTFRDSFVLVRYNSDGSPDLTLAGDGQLFTPFTQSDGAQAVVVQSDGKIVVGGGADGESEESSTDFTLVRYQPTGALDLTFGGDGQVFTPFAAYSQETIQALLLQPDGKIIAAGDTSDGYNVDFALVRYATNGTVDRTFACGDYTQTDFGATADKIKAIALQADGKIVGAGYTYYTIALARYLATGACLR